MDFQYIDDVIKITDKESFNTARRFAREEGIFIGGSGGMAACAALKVAKNLPENKMVVVLLPDSGGKYLTTFFSDDWMRENRFLDIDKISLLRVLTTKKDGMPSLISVTSSDRVRDALAKMQENNISQVPVIDNDKAVGRIEESRLMGQVIAESSLIDQTVAKVMQESFPVISGTKNIDEAKHYLAGEYAAVVIAENDKPVGIITKSDLLEFIAS